MVVPQAILETVVYAEDLDSARYFYEDILGLPLVSAEPGRHLFFRVGNSMLLVFNPEQTKAASVQIGQSMIPRHGSFGESHFAFQVEEEELPEIRKRLLTSGIAIESEIEWPGSGRSIYCRDPARNSVEFATRSLWFAARSVETKR